MKTRLSDIVSPLRNNCRQIVTQQLQKSFSTMSFSTILFNYAIQGKFAIRAISEFTSQVMNFPTVVVISKTYMASKSAHRLLATYNSSTDFRFFPLHSAIIFSCSSIDFSSAAIRASLGEKRKKNIFFESYWKKAVFYSVLAINEQLNQQTKHKIKNKTQKRSHKVEQTYFGTETARMAKFLEVPSCNNVCSS